MLTGTFTPYSGTNTEWCKKCRRSRAEHIHLFPGSDELVCPRSRAEISHGTWRGWAVLCGLVAGFALIVMLISGNDAAQCSTSLGQLAQGFSSQAANDCNTANLVHSFSVFFLIVSVLGGIGSIWKAGRK